MSSPESAVLDRKAIESLIPHAGAMCLLERVRRWDDESIEASTDTHRAPDNPLRADGRLPPEAGIEYAAQAMALHGGLLGQGSGVRRGYVAVVNRVEWTVPRLDSLAGELIVSARATQALADSRHYSFSIESGGQCVVAGDALVVLEGVPA